MHDGHRRARCALAANSRCQTVAQNSRWSRSCPLIDVSRVTSKLFVSSCPRLLRQVRRDIVAASKISKKWCASDMALSCGAKCAKLLLLVFNAVYWVSGVILFAIGLFFLVEDDRSLLFKLFADESNGYALLQYLAWAFVGLGSGIFVIGFCGCCGALRESRWILIVVSLMMSRQLLVETTPCLATKELS